MNLRYLEADLIKGKGAKVKKKREYLGPAEREDRQKFAFKNLIFGEINYSSLFGKYFFINIKTISSFNNIKTGKHKNDRSAKQ